MRFLHATCTVTSYLPLGVLYGFSACIRVLVQHVFRYRRSVIWDNLRQAFPSRSEAEIRRLSKQTYARLCDLLVETVKLAKLEPVAIRQRVSFGGLDIIRNNREQRPMIVMAPHLVNWEWAMQSLKLHVPEDAILFYRPLHVKALDDFIYKIRSRFGIILVPGKDAAREIVRRRRQRCLLIIASDQAPSSRQSVRRVSLLGRETTFSTVVEDLAARLDCRVLFVSGKCTRRGFYEAQIEQLCAPGENAERLLERYALALERAVRAQPDIWLWSHRRWRERNI